MHEIDQKEIEKFVKEVVTIERRYSTEQKNQRTNRITEIRECLDKFATRQMNDEDK